MLCVLVVMQPYFDPTRKTTSTKKWKPTSKKKRKKWKMTSKKLKIEDDLNNFFKTRKTPYKKREDELQKNEKWKTSSKIK